jgi:hypothetical protein
VSAWRARLPHILLIALLLLAAAVRIADYLARRPLWLDEAMLALNLGSRSFAGLVAPLDFDQSAPPLFLWLLKAVTLIGGLGELSLRLVPLLAGLALLWMLWRVTRALVGWDAALIAAALAAVSLPLLRYAGELKPYSTDALLSVVIIALTLRIRSAPEHAARWWQLAAAGIIGLLLSFPSGFVLAGGFAALVLDPRIRGDAVSRRRLGALALGWAAGFAAIFVLVYQPQTTNEYLRRYWSATVLDPSAADFASRVRSAVRRLTSGLPPLDLIDVKGRLAILALGIALIARRGGLAAAAQVGIPFVALGAGALFGKFPVADRLFIFIAPFTFIAVAVLLAELLRLLRLGEAGAGVVGALIVLAWGGPGMVDYRRHPPGQQDGRETALAVSRRRGTEPVYVIPGALPAWAYYTTDWSRPDLDRIGHLAFVTRGAGPGAMNALVREARTDSARDALVYRSDRYFDLLAARPGTVYAEPGGYRRREPVAGWVEREVDRIMAAARPYAWIYAQDHVSTVLPVLRAELGRRGIATVDSLHEKRTTALRIRVPAGPVRDQAEAARP